MRSLLNFGLLASSATAQASSSLRGGTSSDSAQSKNYRRASPEDCDHFKQVVQSEDIISTLPQDNPRCGGKDIEVDDLATLQQKYCKSAWVSKKEIPGSDSVFVYQMDFADPSKTQVSFKLSLDAKDAKAKLMCVAKGASNAPTNNNHPDISHGKCTLDEEEQEIADNYFKQQDKNQDGVIPANAAYGALQSLDSRLTEDDMSKAANIISKKDMISADELEQVLCFAKQLEDNREAWNQYKTMINKADTDHDGKLSTEEFTDYVHDMFGDKDKFAQNLILREMQEANANGDDYISFNEFETLLAEEEGDEMPEKPCDKGLTSDERSAILMAFKAFDINQDGNLSVQDTHGLLVQLYNSMMPKPNMVPRSQRGVRRLMARLLQFGGGSNSGGPQRPSQSKSNGILNDLKSDMLSFDRENKELVAGDADSDGDGRLSLDEFVEECEGIKCDSMDDDWGQFIDALQTVEPIDCEALECSECVSHRAAGACAYLNPKRTMDNPDVEGTCISVEDTDDLDPNEVILPDFQAVYKCDRADKGPKNPRGDRPTRPNRDTKRTRPQFFTRPQYPKRGEVTRKPF